MTLFEVGVLLGLLAVIVALALIVHAAWSIEAAAQQSLAQQKALDGAVLRQLRAARDEPRLVPRPPAGGWPDS